MNAFTWETKVLNFTSWRSYVGYFEEDLRRRRIPSLKAACARTFLVREEFESLASSKDREARMERYRDVFPQEICEYLQRTNTCGYCGRKYIESPVQGVGAFLKDEALLGPSSLLRRSSSGNNTATPST